MKVSKKCKREEKLMGIMWDLIEHVQLPKVVKVRQNFDETRLENVELAVREQFLKSEISSKIKPGMSIALAVGSRGVALIADITKAVASEVRKLGAEPFIVPAMGSHGGATAVGYEKEEKTIACAITVAETEHAAIIGAVAVLPEYQRQGIGTSIVQSLLHRCMEKYQKHIYVYCNSKENALFYRTMGFTDSGVWAESEQI